MIPKLKLSLKPLGDYSFSGFIDNNKIHMSFTIKENNLTGQYFYDKYKTPIEIKGRLDNNSIVICSSNLDEEERFIGIIDSGKIIGIWSKGETKLNFIVSGAGENNPITPHTESILNMSGIFYSTDGDYYANSQIEVIPISDNYLYFDMFAFSGTHLGQLESIAKFDGTNGHYIKNYSREKIHPPEKLDFLDDKQNNMLKELTSEYYEDFITYAQINNSYENIDSFEAEVYSIGLVGWRNIGIIMFNHKNNTIMAAINDNYSDRYFYFSNDKNYQDPPKTIVEFMHNNEYTFIN